MIQVITDTFFDISLSAAWRAFRAGAGVFGALAPAALPEEMPDETAPATVVAVATKAALSLGADDQIVPAGFALEVTPAAVRVLFGSGRSAIELFVPIGGFRGSITVGVRFADCADMAGARESARLRTRAALSSMGGLERWRATASDTGDTWLPRAEQTDDSKANMITIQQQIDAALRSGEGLDHE